MESLPLGMNSVEFENVANRTNFVEIAETCRKEADAGKMESAAVDVRSSSFQSRRERTITSKNLPTPIINASVAKKAKVFPLNRNRSA